MSTLLTDTLKKIDKALRQVQATKEQDEALKNQVQLRESLMRIADEAELSVRLIDGTDEEQPHEDMLRAKLRRVMNAKGLSQNEVGMEIGCSGATIGNFLLDRVGSRKIVTLEKIEDYLDTLC